MHDSGLCVVGGMRGRGHAWQRDMRGRGHAWQGCVRGRGGIRGRGGACMTGGGGGFGIRARQERWPLQQTAFLLLFNVPIKRKPCQRYVSLLLCFIRLKSMLSSAN